MTWILLASKVDRFKVWWITGDTNKRTLRLVYRRIKNQIIFFLTKLLFKDINYGSCSKLIKCFNMPISLKCVRYIECLLNICLSILRMSLQSRIPAALKRGVIELIVVRLVIGKMSQIPRSDWLWPDLQTLKDSSLLVWLCDCVTLNDKA